MSRSRTDLIPVTVQNLRMRDLRLGAGMHYLHESPTTSGRDATLYRIESVTRRAHGKMAFIFCEKIPFGPVDPDYRLDIYVDEPDDDTLDDVDL